MVQVLLRTRKPSSQSREQDDHWPQAAQPPLRVCGDVFPLRRRSSTRAAEGHGLSYPDVGLPPPSQASLAPARPTTTGCTVGVTGSGAVGRAGPGLCPSLAKLQTVRVRQWSAAGEAESLLLARATLGHVHGQPGRPGCVASHFWAGLRVASLELLWGESGFRSSPLPVGLPVPCTAPRAPALRPHQATTRARVAILARTTARLHAASTVAAALAPGAPGSPEDGHRARRVFITEPGEKGGNVILRRDAAIPGPESRLADARMDPASQCQHLCKHSQLTALPGSCPRRCGPRGGAPGCCSFAAGPGSRSHRTCCTEPTMTMWSTPHSWWSGRGQRHMPL